MRVAVFVCIQHTQCTRARTKYERQKKGSDEREKKQKRNQWRFVFNSIR